MTWEGERGGFLRPSFTAGRIEFFFDRFPPKKMAQKMIFLN